MSNTQQMLEEAVSIYDLTDKRTIKLSEKRDKEVLKEQMEIYKAYKEKNYVSTVCN